MSKRIAPRVGSFVAATKARMEVRTGVAHGDATRADEPPSRNVRKREFISDVASVFVSVVVDDDVDDDAVASLDD